MKMHRATIFVLIGCWCCSCSANSIVTRYTQLNHDEPTNAIKETTMTSQQDQFQAEDKDSLWDHLRGLENELVEDEEEEPSHGKEDKETTVFNQFVASDWTTRMSQTTTDEPMVSTQESNVTRFPHQPLSQDTDKSSHFVPKSTRTSDDGEVTTVDNNLNILPPSMVESMQESHRKFNDSIAARLLAQSPKKSILTRLITEEKQKRILMVEADLKEGNSIVKGEEEPLEESNDILRERQNFNERIIKDFNEERLFDSDEQEKEEEEEEVEESNRRISSFYDERGFPSLDENDIDREDSPFKMWDQSSDEQEKLIEEMVVHNESALLDAARLSVSSSDQLQPTGRWFLLLLAGNSTIVRLRQKDFAKYLKLNLAARLSLEYDEVRVNRVVLAPPRLMVNVSVVPSNENGIEDLDEELEVDDRVFGEEEAPLQKLAETNTTLLELSGEEYHLVRFLSLRSQQPVSLDDVPAATSLIVNDRHTDIETVIYVAVGGACAAVILVTVLITLFRYLRTLNIEWPWHRSKPLFNSLPRHQRMSDETLPSIGGPLTVIYSGSFVDRSGPPSGNWLEDHASMIAEDPSGGEGPVYTFSPLNNSILTDALMADVCGPGLTPDSPRQPKPDSKLHILGCRPGHLLIPQQQVQRSSPASSKVTNLDVRINRASVDNPNYQT